MTIRKPKLTDEERANSTVISIRLEKVQERWLTIESATTGVAKRQIIANLIDAARESGAGYSNPKRAAKR